MITRRTFLKVSSAGALTLYALNEFGVEEAIAAAIPGGTLLPGAIPKFVTPLVKPPAMPHSGSTSTASRSGSSPSRSCRLRLPPTTVWSYGSATMRRRSTIPAFTIEATRGTPTTVTWINELRRRQRQLPAPPAARRPDAALGESAERDGSSGERRRDARLAPDLRDDTGAVHRAGADRHARPRHGARGGLERRLRGGVVSCPTPPTFRRVRHGGHLVRLLQGQGCIAGASAWAPGRRRSGTPTASGPRRPGTTTTPSA